MPSCHSVIIFIIICTNECVGVQMKQKKQKNKKMVCFNKFPSLKMNDPQNNDNNNDEHVVLSIRISL